MTRSLIPSRCETAVIAAAAVLTGASVMEAGAVGRGQTPPVPLALINESPSLARGLYVRSGEPAKPGAIVAIVQPTQARAYLVRLGMPDDVFLLKRVAAAEGDRVCARGRDLEAPGRRAPRLERDGLGLVLPAWRGCRVLEPGELFLLGDTPGSFDSRYFGPVRRSEVVGVYREVLTW